MSYAAFKVLHWPTGIENCGSGYITHSALDSASGSNGIDSEWPTKHTPGPIPNLVVTSANILEVYTVRVEEDDDKAHKKEPQRGGIMAHIAGAYLELVCHYRLHGNVYSMTILSSGNNASSRRRDSIMLAFQDAKVSVLEYDDSIHGLRTSSMHCFEGPEWEYMKRGRVYFAGGPLVRVDPQGRCGGALVYGSQMVILKAVQVDYDLVEEDEDRNSGGTISARIESSYIIALRDLDMKHIKDFTFINGYIEPVMVVLHEREPTWTGRISWRQNTCMLSALSISTMLKQHPLIWSASSLPSDLYKILAVPAPLSGVLVVGANSVHYHSQSSTCMLALNGFAATKDNSEEMPRSQVNVELDAANATWLSDDIALFSTKTGELLLLTLVHDGRSVQRLELARSKASVLTSCMTMLGDSFFFLGSRLGDSLLVQCCCGTATQLPPGQGKDEFADIEVDAPSTKRLRRSSSDGGQDMNMDELALYTSVTKNDSVKKSFSFAVRDSLINVGPLKDFVRQSNNQLVCCSGHGKNGAICILQRSVRPEQITEVKLTGCKGIWTVYHKSTRVHGADSSRITSEDDDYHAYLIISLESRTMVLQTADMLGEVTESVDYYVQGSTICAGNLFGRRRVVQIFAYGARVLDGSYMTQDLSLGTPSSEANDGSAVFSADVADPYVLLRMTDGNILLLVGDVFSCTISTTIPATDKLKEKIACCALYQDPGPMPWLSKARADAWLSSGVSVPVDGSDDCLQDQGDVYCLVCYENGLLEIFEVPNFRPIFYVDCFVSGRSVLIDSEMRSQSVDPQKLMTVKHEEKANPGKKDAAENLKVVELAMHRWTGQYSCPFLFGLLNDGTLLCYRAFIYESMDNNLKVEDAVPYSASTEISNTSASRLRNLRFVRVSLESFTREESLIATPSRRMVMFKNIGGFQGFFLCGSRPAWFMLCRERLCLHPQLADGSIVAFTVLHNVNCNHGLIYVNSQGFLKICQLPTFPSYDNYWPVQKIPLKGTPHQVANCADNLYAVIVSIPVIKQLNQILQSLVDQEVSQSFEQNVGSDDLQKTYVIDEFEVRILEQERSSGSWETRITIPMQALENALSLRNVTLFNTCTRESDTLLAVGTAYVLGEDVAARGRILLFSVGRKNGSSNDLISEVTSKELKGAISAMASLQGHLLIAAGTKIVLYKWTGSELNDVAFYDAPLYIVSLNVVKNFILLGDIHKSIYFLSWKEQGSQLSLLAKDFGSLDCFATEFLIDGSTLSLVVSDAGKNIQVFFYAPNKLESWRGQKLLPRAEFHAGSHIAKFLRLQLLPVSTDRAGLAAQGSDRINRFSLLFGTLDGSIGCIIPLDELTFRRLEMLQRKLVDAVAHVCGLNPRSFRHFQSHGKPHRPSPDNIIDCELLSFYELLPWEDQHEIAHQIGTTRLQIITNLNDISLGTSFL